jgi:hypothetical protein
MKPRIASLLRTVEHFGEGGDTSEVDVIRVASTLAYEVGDDLAPELLKLLRHTNANARGVTLLALRRAGWWSNQEIVRTVVACLSDPVAFVRLNAVAALGSSGVRTPLVIEALRRLAEGASAGDTIDFDDAGQQARVQAAKAVAKLNEH